jgi:serine/threonine protein kinase
VNAPPDAPVAYSRLNDRYQILSIVGRGGMASVYKARDEFLDREVAVKLFDASLGDTAEAARQEHELQVLAKLNHHSLVSLIDAGIVRRTDPGLSRMFLVMEFISGSTLKTLAVKEKLSGREIAHIGFDLAEGLEYIHRQGVIHRDIKPANVLMVDYGSGTERRRAKLADFGIALLARNAAADASSTTGTSAYLSPEQAMRDTVGPASDVYSLDERETE